MLVRPCLLLLAGALALAAADAPAPVDAKPTDTKPTPAKPAAPAPANSVDAVTAKRAEQAADAYLRAQSPVRPDPEAENTLAEAELLLLEAQAFLDQKLPLKAGDQYLIAVKKLQSIPADQRPLLGARLRKANSALTALSRRLLDEQAFNLGAPETAPASEAH